MTKLCSHGCGSVAGNDGYCDSCYADQCLVGPDGTCRYVARIPKANITIEFDDGTVASCEIDDESASTVSVVIEAMLGHQMNLKT